LNRTDKIIVIFYVFLAVSFLSISIYNENLNLSFWKHESSKKLPIDEILLIKQIDVNKEKIFNTIADIQNYPIIFPKNVVYVKIINQSDNVIYAEEKVREQFITTKFLVKHTIHPYDNHILEIMDGDAQGTIITQTFEESNGNTTLTTEVKFHLKGILAPFVLFPKSALTSALDTTVSTFVDYSKGFDSEYEKIVDDLYREILQRPADIVGLEYFASLLESGGMTEEDIRLALLESEEFQILKEFKTIDELGDESKKIVDDLYREILQRPADIVGLEYFASLLESGKMSEEDIRLALLESEEGKNALFNDPSRAIITKMYKEIFGKDVPMLSWDEITHYQIMFKIGKMTYEDIRNEFLESMERNTLDGE